MTVRATVLSAVVLLAAGGAFAQDPRIGLAPGYFPYSSAALGVELTANRPRVPPMDAAPGNLGFINSSLAFQGDVAFVGNFNGWTAYDISDPDDPTLITQKVCPGGQGDLSVYGNLLFVSVEENRARIDCGAQGTSGPVDPARLRGVRIFDISDLANPVQVAAVQTCRGSHTHTLVTDPEDPDHVYVYSSGITGVRSAAELAGCENAALTTAPVTTGNPAQWSIDVIKVPLAAPQDAAIVSRPRIFADPVTGAFNGLQNTLPGALHPSGTTYSPLPNTNACSDIAAFPEIGLAAGACQGNGILLDISDPPNPVRLDAVADPNVSYWEEVFFSNDGTKVVFTDGWGGGVSARCRATDQPEWAAVSIYDIVAGKLEFRSYWKLPAPQSTQENCGPAQGGIVPVPGRDVFAQGWFQGGHVLVDFTDSSNPREIAFFDRGPINVPNATGLNLGGYWATHYYNGRTFGSEIARGFDVLRYTPTADLSANEIAAAAEPKLARLNPQLQSRIVHAPSFAVARSHRDQLVRAGAIDAQTLAEVNESIDRAEQLAQGAPGAAAAELDAAADRLSGDPFAALRQALRDLAAALGRAGAPRCDTPEARAKLALASTAVREQCDCDGVASHKDWVRCSRAVLAALIDAGDLPAGCQREARKCTRTSTCGRPGAVTCCRTDRKGRTRCSVRTSPAKCRAPRGGTACVGVHPQCCEACVAGGCAP